MSNTLIKYEEKAKKIVQPQKEKALKTLENTANAKIEQVTDTYNKAIENTKSAYEGEYQKNAVSKLINERVIAEKNANLGLSNSGFNRTQQTANQLSYSNQKSNIDLVRQNAVSTLEGNLASAIAQIKQETEANKMAVEQSYDQYNTQLANQMYDADIKQAEAEKKALVQRSYAGIDKETLKAMYYDENGKLYLYDRGINPYTGTKNSDIENGTTENGYQPDNIEGDKLTKTGETCAMYGERVDIMYDKYGDLWCWDKCENTYQKINDEELKNSIKIPLFNRVKKIIADAAKG